MDVEDDDTIMHSATNHLSQFTQSLMLFVSVYSPPLYIYECSLPHSRKRNLGRATRLILRASTRPLALACSQG